VAELDIHRQLGMKPNKHSHLPRLDPAWYQDHAIIHWIMTMDKRQTGWLTAEYHARFRELLLHTLFHFDLVCPVYCLMPDHMHLLWMGTRINSDQQMGMAFFRRHLNPILAPYRLQKQAYDHILKESEREKNAFQSLVYYILENPVRQGLAPRREQYAYSGSLVSGYPDLEVMKEEYWLRFWRIVGKLTLKGEESTS
jgi:REP element-mobilizing transposase RayT